VTSTPPVVDSQKRLTPNGRLEKRTLLSEDKSAFARKAREVGENRGN